MCINIHKRTEYARGSLFIRKKNKIIIVVHRNMSIIRSDIVDFGGKEYD